ncbi:MAG: endospore germination permease [Oscillospiraceae bacterium]|jgi:spore germination protein KB|nr:endospore germination permease [Oscillospiraceae bacterium]
MKELKLTQGQFISIGMCYMMGSILHSAFVSSVAGRDSWLIPFICALMFLPVAAMCIVLVKRHPDKDLFGINEAALGPVLGRFVSFLYAVFFLCIASLNASELENFVTANLLNETSIVVITIVTIGTCCYALGKGLNTIARLPMTVLVLGIAVLGFEIIISIQQMDFTNVQPILAQEPMVYVRSGHIMSSISLGESIGMLIFAGKLKQKNSGFTRGYLFILGYSVLYLSVTHLRETLLLGRVAEFSMLPSFDAVRLINFGTSLSSTESIYSLMMMTFSMFRILISFYGTLQALKHILRLEHYKSLLLPVGALIAVYSLKIMGSAGDSFYFGTTTSPFFWTAFEFVLPTITLIGSLIRGFVKKRRETDKPAKMRAEA